MVVKRDKKMYIYEICEIYKYMSNRYTSDKRVCVKLNDPIFRKLVFRDLRRLIVSYI